MWYLEDLAAGVRVDGAERVVEEIDATRGTWSEVERVKEASIEVGKLEFQATLMIMRSSLARTGESCLLDHMN